ncbi:transposase (plasmid) [Flammeovirga pectinis]|uniref:Transposase n=1 Tax=Flammeovirga pectinis TaxID=2494373 RepID=A0A3S9PBT8_9BACT|nr:transposase [Flammeovirga pectinis]AZQ65609.1 transposase [Flammeovirga pectinis]
MNQVNRCLFLHSNERTTEESTFIEALYDKIPHLEKLRKRYFEYRNIFLSKLPDKLPTWLASAKELSIEGLTRLVGGIERAMEAVKNAAIYELTNGQVEGQVNKLKMIKRKGYGRAKLPFLEKQMMILNEL